ncbi:hypothetical protein DSM106972_025390 [Dulcicalothrix desertica PCC 7102]|uniref:Uncharacterized protein n=1 Tax=Dulcicalothrix desertica PCC 7102 TaxID=232991 RepID=A0A433VMC9_9CYAN|nr:hypothetical protein [Dulcicalothrix desertica]RUT07278.1 hypothetical protein DSM106972_025390 [Dulcicalothrix desertica PCC 7102]TWH55518.1 hypothetical protein CAL7102_03662 [Dulcicalothrix desertica PCC 7102]
MWIPAGFITPDKTWNRLSVQLNEPREIQLIYSTNWNDWNNDSNLRSYGGLRYYSPKFEGLVGFQKLYPNQINQIILVPDKLQLLDLYVEVRQFSYTKKNYWKPREELIWNVEINFQW